MSFLGKTELKVVTAATVLVATTTAAIGVVLADVPAQTTSARQAMARQGCPHNTTPLRPDAVAGATEAALAQGARLYTGTNRTRALVTKAIRATADPDRGDYARIKCGRTIQARSVVVYLEFPAERPSASLAQGVLVVSSTSRGYVAWARLH
jgi:hypothetical protein